MTSRARRVSLRDEVNRHQTELEFLKQLKQSPIKLQNFSGRDVPVEVVGLSQRQAGSFQIKVITAFQSEHPFNEVLVDLAIITRARSSNFFQAGVSGRNHRTALTHGLNNRQSKPLVMTWE